MKRKLCVLTGTRAEYGLLSNLMKLIQQDNEFELQIIATGMHLSPEFGLTYKQIEADGFHINEKVEMLLSADTSTAVVKSMGLATISFADVYARLNPDLLIILGDRFEMLAAAQTALIMQIPIAHIHGGECTFGAYDDAIRHSITKMATWHFTSTEGHRKRVMQLGENPKRVFNVGALGVEHTLKLNLLTKNDLYEQLKLNKEKEILLVTYHPETNSSNLNDINDINELISALGYFNKYNLIFTKSNADNGGRYINEKIENALSQFEDAFLFDSLGQLRYLSTVKYASAVIGNSSSGLIEVPYLQTPTVNIGNRQAGRESPISIFHCQSNSFLIKKTIEKALRFNGDYEQIFGDGNTSQRIIDYLLSFSNYSVEKVFYDLE